MRKRETATTRTRRVASGWGVEVAVGLGALLLLGGLLGLAQLRQTHTSPASSRSSRWRGPEGNPPEGKLLADPDVSQSAQRLPEPPASSSRVARGPGCGGLTRQVVKSRGCALSEAQTEIDRADTRIALCAGVVGQPGSVTLRFEPGGGVTSLESDPEALYRCLRATLAKWESRIGGCTVTIEWKDACQAIP
jgi:hypothetical protein